MSRKGMRVIFGSLLVVGVLALAACGTGSGAGAKTTPTATPGAAQIVAHIKNLQFKDATFTMTFNFTTQGQTVSGSGGGKFTKNPDRSDIQLAFPLTVSGSTYNLQYEVITDGTTSYTMITSNPDIPGVSTGGMWTKGTTDSSSSSSPFGNTSQFGDFATGLGSPTLVGTETVNGVATYHLKGTDTSTAGSSIDLYVRTDNYQPVKADFTETGSSSGNFTLVFTGFNSGISIATPPASQVTGS
ncbi:MAG TPA: hypothetical protein VJN88_01375 [Ktedonobacterales bacterium]|nr:hypothetical protein [Ktedonobacterales bacterium]